MVNGVQSFSHTQFRERGIAQALHKLILKIVLKCLWKSLIELALRSFATFLKVFFLQ